MDYAMWVRTVRFGLFVQCFHFMGLLQCFAKYMFFEKGMSYRTFYEELIFRGTLQLIIGVIPAALAFTAIHVSYYKKPVLLIDVFIQGLILGALYYLTGSVWITTIAHTLVNTIQMWMIKKGIIEY